MFMPNDTIGYEVLHLQTSDIDDAVVVEAVNVQVAVQVTGGVGASVGKTYRTAGVGVAGKEIGRVLVVEPVVTQHQRHLPLTLLRSKHYTLFIAL